MRKSDEVQILATRRHSQWIFAVVVAASLIAAWFLIITSLRPGLRGEPGLFLERLKDSWLIGFGIALSSLVLLAIWLRMLQQNLVDFYEIVMKRLDAQRDHEAELRKRVEQLVAGPSMEKKEELPAKEG